VEGLPQPVECIGAYPLSRRLSKHCGVGVRTPTSFDPGRREVVTVAGLCRIHTGFAALQRVVG